jgi:hypothetical protein
MLNTPLSSSGSWCVYLNVAYSGPGQPILQSFRRRVKLTDPVNRPNSPRVNSSNGANGSCSIFKRFHPEAFPNGSTGSGMENFCNCRVYSLIPLPEAGNQKGCPPLILQVFKAESLRHLFLFNKFYVDQHSHWINQGKNDRRIRTHPNGHAQIIG